MEDSGSTLPKRKHEWIWCCDICNDMYCCLCYESRDFSIDEKDEPPCHYTSKNK